MRGLRIALAIALVGLFSVGLGLGCNSPHATAGAPSGSASTSTTSLREATIPIDGMSCGSCVARVKRKLKSMDGVVDVDVSLEHRNALVRYDEAKMSPERLVAAINDLGYTAGAATLSPPAGGAK